MKDTHPFNVIRYCPRCGSARFPAVTEKSFRCSQCGFHLFINSAAAVAALVGNDKGELLLTRRKHDPDAGKLDLPGGFVDPGETAEEALERELFEELGLKIKKAEFMFSRPNEYIFSGISVFTLDMAFRVEPVDFEEFKPMDDILEFGFYSFDDINWDDIPAPSIRYFAQEFFRE